MSERKLATIRAVDSIQPIDGADAIELAIVGGWQCVVKKGTFQPGELACYFEIDSFVPFTNKAFDFLDKKDGRQTVFNSVAGHRVRTIKLRKQLSQGLLIPLEDLFYYCSMSQCYYETLHSPKRVYLEEGMDVTEYLAIQKYDKPIPAELAGTVRSTFPSFIQKTDQERFQNIAKKVFEMYFDSEFEVTQKLDGSSMTVYYRDGDIGVCSRNLSLIETEGNAMWEIAKSTGMIMALNGLKRNIAIQGEIVGPGINGNKEGLKEVCFYMFDIFDIDAGRYLLPVERMATYDSLAAQYEPDLVHHMWLHAPILMYKSLDKIILTEESGTPYVYTEFIQDMLKLAEGPNLSGTGKREGVVFKACDSDFSFKVISNSYLLEHGE